MFKWNHLPVSGGIYEQHPKVLDDFLVIDQINIAAKNRRQAMEARKARRK
jgi:hypothetical protein